jgi:hypothetical protein
MHSREVKIIDLVEEHLQTKKKTKMRGEDTYEPKIKRLRERKKKQIISFFMITEV